MSVHLTQKGMSQPHIILSIIIVVVIIKNVLGKPSDGIGQKCAVQGLFEGRIALAWGNCWGTVNMIRGGWFKGKCSPMHLVQLSLRTTSLLHELLHTYANVRNGSYKSCSSSTACNSSGN
eukprot:6215619-Amphidinium_carterae.1